MKKPAKPRILTIDGGSSSIKFAQYEAGDALGRILEGEIDRIGVPEAVLRVTGLDPMATFSRPVTASDHTVAVGILMDWIEARGDHDAMTAIGHRVVRVAKQLPIPRRYEAQGIRRYGFHGLPYAFLMGELARLAGTQAAQGRVILAHLGNGASLAAVRDGKSVDTSMGFTPAAGVPMSTRSGDLDPGLAWYLAHTEKMNAQQFNEMVNSRSGLLGVSETSSDMRDLLERETQDVRAAGAVALFCYQIRKWIGAFTAALGGLDTLVFAGGIGENAPLVRARICDEVGFLGIELDTQRNEKNAELISPDDDRVKVRVIHTDEALMIARSVAHVLNLGPYRKHQL